ncbi:uncharacterized protein LOC34620166 [Cyclospora cayetanensis]|uniref:Uncharacterized protein LOC34620166 n=1 Tax=Cyclospora cayetanensis TaxID=88456 RepID=A0A6P6RSN2_9EIME|nr:uncharacterized protein LOC34620166 [Cyclospora cayetanensis]
MFNSANKASGIIQHCGTFNYSNHSDAAIATYAARSTGEAPAARTLAAAVATAAGYATFPKKDFGAYGASPLLPPGTSTPGAAPRHEASAALGTPYRGLPLTQVPPQNPRLVNTHNSRRSSSSISCCCCWAYNAAIEARNAPAEVYRQLCANRAANVQRLEALCHMQQKSSCRRDSSSSCIVAAHPRAPTPRAVQCCAAAATAGESVACRVFFQPQATASAGAASAGSPTAAPVGAFFALESDQLAATCLAPFVFTQRCASSAAATASAESAAASCGADIVEWNLFGCLFFPAPGEGTSALLIAVDSGRSPTATVHALQPQQREPHQQQQPRSAAASRAGQELLLQLFHLSSLRAQRLVAEIPLGDLPAITHCCYLARTVPKQYQKQQEQRQDSIQETIVAAWDATAKRFIVVQLRPSPTLPKHEPSAVSVEVSNTCAAPVSASRSEGASLDGPSATAETAAAEAAATTASAGLPLSSKWRFISLDAINRSRQRQPVRMQLVQPFCVGAARTQQQGCQQRECAHLVELPALLVGYSDGALSLLQLPQMQEIQLLGRTSVLCRGSAYFSEFVDGRGLCRWGDMLLLLQIECHCCSSGASSDTGKDNGLKLHVFLLAVCDIPDLIAEARAKGASKTTDFGAPHVDDAEAEAEDCMAVHIGFSHTRRTSSAGLEAPAPAGAGAAPEEAGPDSVEPSYELQQLTFNGEESIVTFRHPSCICFLTVHRILQGHQQQRLHQEKLRCGVAGLCFRNIRTASTRAGASFIVPYLDETGCTAAETTSASTSPVVERAATVSCLLKWSTFPPMSPAGLISGWSDEMGSKCWQEGQHVLQPTTGDKLACLAFKTRLACYTPQPVRCVALDKHPSGQRTGSAWVPVSGIPCPASGKKWGEGGSANGVTAIAYSGPIPCCC